MTGVSYLIKVMIQLSSRVFDGYCNFVDQKYFVKTSTKLLLSKLGSKHYFISVKDAGVGGEGGRGAVGGRGK